MDSASFHLVRISCIRVEAVRDLLLYLASKSPPYSILHRLLHFIMFAGPIDCIQYVNSRSSYIIIK